MNIASRVTRLDRRNMSPAALAAPTSTIAALAAGLLFFAGTPSTGFSASSAAPPEAGDEAAAALMREAEAKVLDGDPGSAVSTFHKVVNRYRQSPLAPQAQFRIAQLYERNRQHAEAFEAYQVLIDHFPESDLYTRALDSQYRIADRVLDAYSLRERKGSDRIEEPLKDEKLASRMLRILIENGRFSERAPEARFRLGVALEKEEWPRTAIEEHEKYLDDYPRHSLADEAAFQIAYINYKLCRDRNQEDSLRKAAQLGFLYFVEVYPESPKVPMASHLLAELDSIEFNALVREARFYDDQGDIKSATIYYRDIEERFPQYIHSLEWLPSRLEALRSSGQLDAPDIETGKGGSVAE